MAQDTRKDPRAKVLTMTVRYKSATLDEFIENHSHDVSRGGMFIKTPSPFPPGTLLKFEVKIAGEQRLIQGVGRVVWRRDTSDSATERPAGMGIKFIKLDDKSKQVIESLVEKRRDEESAFELGAKASVSGGAPRPEREAAEDVPTKMIFPEGPSNPPAPEDRTMVKQAAELLQEALREAGGSIQDVEEAPAEKPPPKPEPARRMPEQSEQETAKPASAPAQTDKAQAAPAPEPERLAQRTQEKARRVSTPARAAQSDERGGGGGRAVVILLALGVAVAAVYLFAQREPSAPTPKESPSAEQQAAERAKPEEVAPPRTEEPAGTVAAADAAVADAGKPDAEVETKPVVAKPAPMPEVKPEKRAAVKPAPVVPKVSLRPAKPEPEEPVAGDAGPAAATPTPFAPESAPEPAPAPAPAPTPVTAPIPAPTPAPELPAAGPEPKNQPAPSAPAETNPY
ncbi:MAG: TIGR02266 family protein [Polyangiaceae bacterium]|nr:TIGR02266 family protein [Polyangiaceae bacterium]